MTTPTNADFVKRIYKLKTSTVKLELSEPPETMDYIAEPSDARAIAQSLYSALDADREHFGILLLDNKHRIFGFKILFSGTINSCSTYTRDVFSTTLRMGAAAVIAVHNHPSGNSSPSPEDRKVCANLKDAAKILDVAFLDFLILGTGTNFYSAANSLEL
jgi:DNA repair protein RadC